MKLDGSCHCKSVQFTVQSNTFYPYNRCYCTICRKTAGGGGYAINIMGDASTLKVTGADFISIYRSRQNNRENYEQDGLAKARRHFCSLCGSALWIHGTDWPDFVYPFASAIDTPLPQPPESTHLMLAYKAAWVALDQRNNDVCFNHYPKTGINDWHTEKNLKEI